MSDTIAISSNSLCKTYSDGFVFRKKFQALNDVSFDVKKGQVFGLLGPNGAGKTTFIKILLGIIRKSGGSASILGMSAGSRAARQKVGYLPEHLRIPPHMTAYTALECYGNLSNISNSVVRSKRDELLKLVGLAERARDRVKKFSKGMLQRLGLAQALLHDPPLLILDEPTDGLDPRARAEMRQIIKRLKDKGVTIFLNSHILQEVEMICERVAILDRGKLQYCGAVDEIGEFVDSKIGHGPGQIKVTMELAGDPDAVKKFFDGQIVSILAKSDGDKQTVELTIANQEELDKVIDRFRQDGISLWSLTRQQVSLEDAFLQIVRDPSVG